MLLVSKLVQAALLLTTVGGFAAVIRARYRRWGATDADLDRVLAGDAELAEPTSSATRAITITAPAEQVWPWVAQLGQGRGGFYSYNWLENLVPRTDIHNADRVVPEWQHVAVGSQVRLAPDVPLQVAAVDAGRSLVLRGSVPIGTVPAPYEFTWAFVLLRQLDGTTRLLVRERYAYTRRWAGLIVQPAQLVSCLMTPKMLRGIRDRAQRPVPAAEADARERVPHDTAAHLGDELAIAGNLQSLSA
ncbi:SRPBCC family protein [Nakamurella sp. GG22]